ncbi:MAG: LysR family transcriptional regulator [Ferrovibrio sp.]
MEMHQIRYFLAVCDTLNFTRAAEACNVAQPSLTRAIKALEDELGGELFRRERGRTHLSDLGSTVRPYLQSILEQADTAKQRAKGLKTLTEGRLDLGIMCTIGPGRLAGMLNSFQASNPGVELHVSDAAGIVLQDRLLEGSLDVAIFDLPGGIDDRLAPRPLFSEQLVVAVAPSHHFAQKNVVRLEELGGERYVNRTNCEFIDSLSELLSQRQLATRKTFRSDRDDWVQAMIMSGLGFGLLPESVVSMPGLITRPLIDPEIRRTINLVTVRGRPHTPAVASFVRTAAAFVFS